MMVYVSTANLSFRAVDPKCFVVSDFVQDHYERCHPGDTWESLERRARFDRFSRGLRDQWLALARRRLSTFERVVSRRMQKQMDEMLVEQLWGKAA
jgi:hypothetical protein